MRYLVFGAFFALSLANANEISSSNDSIAKPLTVISESMVQDIKVEILKEGQGEGAEKEDNLSVHYKGTLSDGVEFDNSYKRETPFELIPATAQVIEGWKIGLLGMKKGEIRRLTIPPEKGYGDRAISVIPANSTLIFEVELVDLLKPLSPDSLVKITDEQWLSHPRGLKFYTEKQGLGNPARTGSKLKVHYSGWLLGGTKFGTSKTSPKPAELTLGTRQVIPGWEFGLAGIQEGEVRWLKIPPQLGYNNQPMARIPPNSTLIFKVEVIDIAQDESFTGDVFPLISKVEWQELVPGLKYSVEKEGQGEAIATGSKVKVHYTGWLPDGTEFDSSRPRQQTFEFQLGGRQVIAGWDQGVVGMKIGERRLLHIQPSLGYGAKGAGIIPANSELIFMVERTE